MCTQRTRKLEKCDPIDKVVEVACGHGLVSLLLAYRFPTLKFFLYDLKKRPSFELFIRYFELHGQKLSGYDRVLPNIEFKECDMREATADITSSSIVIAIHGCNNVNQISIEMAKTQCAGWIVMPCCIHRDLYLGRQCVFQLEDDDRDIRHHIQCGIIAQTYGAQVISEIDRRITNRPVIIAGDLSSKEIQTNVDGLVHQRNKLTMD